MDTEPADAEIREGEFRAPRAESLPPNPLTGAPLPEGCQVKERDWINEIVDR
jgi:hypothetical protein